MVIFLDHPLPNAVLPECVISESGENYQGTQWITENGEACVPWNISSVRKVSQSIILYIFGLVKNVYSFCLHSKLVKENMLIDGSYAKAKNYCRNPTKNIDGPYCYVSNDYNGVKKQPCRIRKCENTSEYRRESKRAKRQSILLPKQKWNYFFVNVILKKRSFVFFFILSPEHFKII